MSPWKIIDNGCCRWQQLIDGKPLDRARFLCGFLLANLVISFTALFIYSLLPHHIVSPLPARMMFIAFGTHTLIGVLLIGCFARMSFLDRHDSEPRILLHGLSAGSTLLISLGLFFTGAQSSPLLLWLVINILLILLVQQGRQSIRHLFISVMSFGLLTLLALYQPQLATSAGAASLLQSHWGITIQLQTLVAFSLCVLIFARVVSANHKYTHSLKKLTYTDGLTGLRNRYQLEEKLNVECDRAQRNHQPISLLMIDIDNFKRLNDSYGHQAGDQVLRGMGNILQEYARSYDLACRYGGEEFLLLLPATSQEEALLIAERYRQIIEQQLFFSEHERHRITISLGLATNDHQHRLSAKQLIYEADSALYKAKKNGRNQIYTANTGGKSNILPLSRVT